MSLPLYSRSGATGRGRALERCCEMARGECCGCTRRCSWRKHWLLLVVCLEYALQKVHTASSLCVARAAPRDSSPGVRGSSPGVRACVLACSRARVATGAAAGASQGTPLPRVRKPLWRGGGLCAWAPAGGALGATSGARMHVAHTSARPGGASAPARARGGRHARGRLQLQLQGELQLSCAARALLPAPRAAAPGAPAVCAAESASYGRRAGSGGRAGRQCGALAQRWGRSGSRAHFPCPWRLRRGPSGGARAPLSAQAPSATASSGGSGGGSLCDKAERLAAAAGGAYAPSEADAAAGGGEGARTAPLWRPR